MKLKFLHDLRNQRKPRAKGKCEKKPRKPLFVKKGSHKYPRSLEERLVDLIGRCVHVTYYDHLLLRNVPINSLKKLKKLPTRETVGWLDDVGFEGDLSYVMIRWDRSVGLPEEREDRISGMIILKPLILEVKEVRPV